MLRPAGKAMFGDHYVDVVSDGPYVQPGTPIENAAAVVEAFTNQ